MKPTPFHAIKIIQKETKNGLNLSSENVKIAGLNFGTQSA
jgi:hypothetical protein